MHDPEKNKQNAIDFYRTAYLGDPERAVERYVGDSYTQHNPLVGDGPGPFIDYFKEMAARFPGKQIEFVRAVAEGDLVALHTHQTWPIENKPIENKPIENEPNGDASAADEYVTMDFFRFDSHGKIVEHWDSIQQVPAQSKNGNTMY